MKISDKIGKYQKIHSSCWECGIHGVAYRIIDFEQKMKCVNYKTYRVFLCKKHFTEFKEQMLNQ